MYKYLFSLSILILLFPYIQLQGQKRTYSPASRYGIGELKRSGYGQSAGMGQTGIALGSASYLNNLNPASYSSMDTLSFYFEAGVRGFYQSFEDQTSSGTNSNMVFDYFAFGFPISKKICASLGLTTFSETGYELEKVLIDEATYGTAYNYYTGNGSINKTYLGLSLSPLKNMQVGLHASYLFGNLKNVSYITFSSQSGAMPYGTSKETHVSDIYFDFGAQYKFNLTPTSKITIGAVYTPAQKINNNYSSIVAQALQIKDENNLVVVADTLKHDEFEEKNFSIPLSYGFGASYQIDNKLTLTVDYKYESWSNSTTPDPLTNTTVDMTRLSGGVEFIPNDRSARSYLQRVRYRAGSYYMNDYVEISGQQVEEFGMSFGLGFPLKRSKSSINVAFEMGKKNYHIDMAFKESYARLLVNVSLHEFWFVKSKFE
jgi:long-subunit fatty acid transport protein